MVEDGAVQIAESVWTRNRIANMSPRPLQTSGILIASAAMAGDGGVGGVREGDGEVGDEGSDVDGGDSDSSVGGGAGGGEGEDKGGSGKA